MEQGWPWTYGVSRRMRTSGHQVNLAGGRENYHPHRHLKGVYCELSQLYFFLGCFQNITSEPLLTVCKLRSLAVKLHWFSRSCFALYCHFLILVELAFAPCALCGYSCLINFSLSRRLCVLPFTTLTFDPECHIPLPHQRCQLVRLFLGNFLSDRWRWLWCGESPLSPKLTVNFSKSSS